MVEKDSVTSNVVLSYPASGTSEDSHDYHAMGWKGFEDADEPTLPSRPENSTPRDELDMTPMVDVTFLLLIFFMVTASFSLQKSLPVPDSLADKPGRELIDPESPITVTCLLYTSPSPRDATLSRMPSSA